MFDWFRRLTRVEGGSSRVARGVACSRPGSAWRAGGFDRCVELYKLNEAGRFPSGGLTEFENALRGSAALRFVVEQGNEVRGCGAVHIRTCSTGMLLSYGLVHPQWHGKGFGNALLLVRLACLPKKIEQVVLQAVPASLSFYGSYGFLEVRKVDANVAGDVE